MVIGEKDVWGRGYGAEAARAMVAHGFRAANLHRITAATVSANAAMCRIALAVGMTEEGRRREAAFTDGEYHDVVEFGILAAEHHTKEA